MWFLVSVGWFTFEPLMVQFESLLFALFHFGFILDLFIPIFVSILIYINLMDNLEQSCVNTGLAVELFIISSQLRETGIEYFHLATLNTEVF